jgi:hypothetical protein
VDGTQVYWSARAVEDLNGTTYSAIKIYSAPKMGGNSAKTELASIFNAVATGFALDDDRVYWTTTQDTILSVPKGGNAGVTTVLAANPKFNLVRRGVAVDADRTYWMEGAVDILSIPKGGGMPTVLSTQPPDALSFTADAKRLYWGDVSLGHVTSISKSGGAPKTIVTGEQLVAAITVSSSCVYWIAVDEQGKSVVRAASKNGGPAITISPTGTAPNSVVVADDTHVYWEDRSTHSLMQATK